jgi:exopolyphosphatase/guanosine-5'-triphosphate,3'-diphosphate pyrophosphatase
MNQPGPFWAGIDVGTNSVLMTVVDASDPGQFKPIVTRATVTRLGQGVDQTGQLHPEAEARTLLCLAAYKNEMDSLGVSRSRAVGTSALRDARGAEDFLQRARETLGFDLEVIAGDEEARLTFEGALVGLPLFGRAFVFDIGGGSTEFISGEIESGRIESAISLNVGSVRLTERCCLSDPPTQEQLDHLRREIKTCLRDLKIQSHGASVVGVAGTITSLVALSEELAEYDPKLVHGYRLKKEVVDHLVHRLSHMTVAERRTLPGLSPGRADVIIAGAMLCQEILLQQKADALIASDTGVSFGLLRAMVRDDTPHR